MGERGKSEERKSNESDKSEGDEGMTNYATGFRLSSGTIRYG